MEREGSVFADVDLLGDDLQVFSMLNKCRDVVTLIGKGCSWWLQNKLRPALPLSYLFFASLPSPLQAPASQASGDPFFDPFGTDAQKGKRISSATPCLV
jgi:hypothetical protein